jgi:adenylate cyclase
VHKDLSNDEMWHQMLEGTLEGLEPMKALFRRMPSAPRCKLCAAPFSGFGGTLLKLTPWRRWRVNAAICTFCTGNLGKGIGGTEIEATFLFADIRGSTSVAERLRPAEYQQILARFYRDAAMAVDEAGGVVDKFLGDGIVAFFVPAFSGDGGPAASAVRAGRSILERVGPRNGQPAWLPVGVGVHAGITYLGVMGIDDGTLDFTGVGDVVNTAARLGSVAAAGELLVSVASARLANLDLGAYEHRTLELKGREEPVEVVVLAADVPLAERA